MKNSNPIWTTDQSSPIFPKLDRKIYAEVLVIGGGMTGASVAYHLVKKGKQVVLVDGGSAGEGETGRTTAHLTYVLDNGYRRLEEAHGHENARRILESHQMAIQDIETIARQEHIDCDFERVPGYLFLDSKGSRESLVKEREILQGLGVDVPWVDEVPVPFFHGPCLCFPDQAEMHPIKYLTGLLRVIQAA